MNLETVVNWFFVVFFILMLMVLMVWIFSEMFKKSPSQIKKLKINMERDAKKMNSEPEKLKAFRDVTDALKELADLYPRCSGFDYFGKIQSDDNSMESFHYDAVEALKMAEMAREQGAVLVSLELLQSAIRHMVSMENKIRKLEREETE